MEIDIKDKFTESKSKLKILMEEYRKFKKEVEYSNIGDHIADDYLLDRNIYSRYIIAIYEASDEEKREAYVECTDSLMRAWRVAIELIRSGVDPLIAFSEPKDFIEFFKYHLFELPLDSISDKDLLDLINKTIEDLENLTTPDERTV
jgi:hypothetical protein